MPKHKITRRVEQVETLKSGSPPKREVAVYRERVYDIVRGIPPGLVMTYGQIAILLGEGYTPRTVGYVMHASEQHDVPWQRVINSQGACSTGRIILPSNMQQRMLEQEGIKFDRRGRCDLEKYRWSPDEEDILNSVRNEDERPRLFRRRNSRIVKPKSNKELSK